MRSVILTVLSLIASVAFSQVTYNHKVDGDLFPGIDFRSNYLKDGMFEKSLSVGVSDPSGIASLVDGGAPVGSDRYLQITSTAGSQVVRIKGRGLRYTTYGLNCEAHWRYTGSGDSNFKFNVTDPNNSNASVGATYTILSNDSTSLWHIGTIYFPCGTSAHTYDITVTSLATASTIEIDNAYLGEALLGTSTPDTVWQDAGPMTVDAITTSPVKGTATEHTWWRRNGPNVDIRYEYAQTALGSATSGSGDFRWTIPSSIGCTIDTSKVTAYATSANNVPITNSVGHVFVSNGTPVNGHGIVVVYDSTRVRFYADNASNGLTAVSSTWFAYGGAGSVYHNAYFSVPCSGWTPQTAIQTQNSNTSWASYTPDPATNQGMGTLTMKLCQWRHHGENMEGDCTFQTGTAAASEMRLALPTGYTTDSTKIATTPNGAGSASACGSLTRSGTTGASDTVVLCEPSKTYVTFAISSGTLGGLTKANGSTVVNSNEVVTVRFSVPISGWTENQNAPQLVGSVVGGTGVTNYFSGIYGGANSITICSSSPCTVYGGSGNFTSVTRVSTGTYTLNVPAGTCSQQIICVNNHTNTANFVTVDLAQFSSSAPSASTTTTYTWTVVTTAAAPIDAYGTFQCSCQK